MNRTQRRAAERAERRELRAENRRLRRRAGLEGVDLRSHVVQLPNGSRMTGREIHEAFGRLAAEDQQLVLAAFESKDQNLALAAARVLEAAR